MLVIFCSCWVGGGDWNIERFDCYAKLRNNKLTPDLINTWYTKNNLEGNSDFQMYHL